MKEEGMNHRVVVIGAGYAGLMTAKRLARRLRRDQVHVTLVNGRAEFVERVRLHQLAAGQRLRHATLADLVDGTGIELVVDRVTDVDRAAKRVHLDAGDALRYDTLVYALGSGPDTTSVPGIAEHAYPLGDLDHAAAFATALPELVRTGGRVRVVGGGLTGIEAAAELAEAHPELRTSLVCGTGLGPGLSDRGRDYVHEAMTRLGVTVHEHAKVGEVTAAGLHLVDGSVLPANAVLWTAGFTVPDLACRIGLAVNAGGRIVVDDTQRSVTDPDVYAVGDAATVPGPGGRELRMACATGTPMGVTAADAIAARLTGRTPRRHAFRYYAQNLSLGRRDGLFQWVRADDTPRDRFFTGRRAAWAKERIVRFAALRPQRLTGPYRIPR
jgi:NADH:quinone reductase (non-electrogenic)